MFKVFRLPDQAPGTTREEFTDYYENHHVPLVLSLSSMPRVYTLGGPGAVLLDGCRVRDLDCRGRAEGRRAEGPS